eukprot:4339218-Pyramimonas_sp.AAC.1
MSTSRRYAEAVRDLCTRGVDAFVYLRRWCWCGTRGPRGPPPAGRPPAPPRRRSAGSSGRPPARPPAGADYTAPCTPASTGEERSPPAPSSRPRRTTSTGLQPLSST